MVRLTFLFPTCFSVHVGGQLLYQEGIKLVTDFDKRKNSTANQVQ